MTDVQTTLEEVKKMVIDRPGFVSIDIGKDISDRDAIVITIEKSYTIHYIDIPVSLNGYNIRTVGAHGGERAQKRTTHIDLRRYV